MFDRWQGSFIEHPSAPVQLCLLLATAVEDYKRKVRMGVLRIAVQSSPQFSDAGFTKTLLDRLIPIIQIPSEGTRAAMLSFCVLCATDSEFLTVSKARN
jgi:hypothetical protein